jgi:hypothetical protein
MTKRQLSSPFPLSPPAQTESTHTTKSTSYCQNTNLLSNNVQSVESHLFTCGAENAVENQIIDLAYSPFIRHSISVYLRSGEWRAVFRWNWRRCLAFPADLSERRRQNEVRRSKCALEWHCRVLTWSIIRSKKFVFGVFATASWRWWK